MKTDYKLAVSDIDGTLAVIGEDISVENMNAIQSLQNNGLEIVLASGRHHENMEPFCEKVPGVNWIISVQGGMIANRDRTKVLYCNFMDRQLVDLIVQEGKREGYSILVYTQDGVFSPDDDQWVDYYQTAVNNIVTYEAYDELLMRSAFKVVWISDEEKISTAPSVVPEIDNVIQLRTHPHFYEFMPSTTSKGHAVEILAKYLGITLQEVLTLGDRDNDVSMLEISGTSIAMGHGSEAAIAAGTIVTPANIPQRALAWGVNAFFEG